MPTNTQNHVLYLALLGKVAEAKEMLNSTQGLINSKVTFDYSDFGSIDDLNTAIEYNLDATGANLCALSGMVEMLDILHTITGSVGMGIDFEIQSVNLQQELKALTFKYDNLVMINDHPAPTVFMISVML
jgi:hypothetical protein